MTIETPQRDIASIQILRGIAALMVVLVHLNPQLHRMGHSEPWPAWLNAGVDIFFVISGFIMWVSTEANAQRTAREFMLNRIIRIVPLYWALTLAMVAMMIVAPNLLQSAVFDTAHVLKSFLFLPARHPATGLFFPVVIPGWTLNYEMFFYLLFAIAIALSGGRSSIRGLLVAVFICSALLLAWGLTSAVDVAEFYASTIMLEFLFGIAIGHLYVTRKVNPHLRWWGMTLVGFGLLSLTEFYDIPRFISAGLPSAMIVAGAAFGTPLNLIPLKQLGDVSYSLYLSQVISLSALGQSWRFVGLGRLHPALFCVVAIVVSIAVAAIIYRLIERPLTRAAKRSLMQPARASERALSTGS